MLNTKIEEDLLAPSDAAKLLKVSPRTIERWRLLSMGPPYVRLGKRVWYRKSSVLEFIATQEHTPPNKF